MPSRIDRVILSYPTHLSDVVIDAPQSVTNTTDAPQSWIQVARTGEFVSQRYGEFAITREDLAQMVNNFHNITPQAPTRLPIDYDHLSMSPEKPGDGIAAGWVNDLELRNEGDELWALVEWTPEGAKAVQNKHYQFVSPSFVKDYVHKSGEKIGTTLLAAAITNHPFLEGMAALTLSAGLKEMATPMILAANDNPPADAVEGLPADATGPEEGVSLEVGQKVTVKDAEVQKPEQMGVVFTIGQVVGEGADAFVSLEAPDGTVAEWFRADELAPAPASTELPPDLMPAPGEPPAATMATATAPVVPPPVNARRPAMPEYRLTDDTGKEITLSADVLQQVVAKAIPGQVLIKATELNDLKGKVTNLTSQVETMAKTAADAEARARAIELDTELKKLSQGGYITKMDREWALKQYKDAVDLAAFHEWRDLQMAKGPLVKLNTEHGSGMDTHLAPGEDASQQLMSLAQKLQKEKRIPLREALVLAGRQNADAAERYKDHFRTTSPSVQ